MELRPDNSDASTRKNYQNNQIVLVAPESNITKYQGSQVQENDLFTLTFVDYGLLVYSNPIDHNLVVQQNISSYQYWRTLFLIHHVEGASHYFYLIHKQTQLYLTANLQTIQQATSSSNVYLSEKPQKCSIFKFQISNNGLEDRQGPRKILYQTAIKVKNVQTEKYLQVNKQNPFVHLSKMQQTQINLKLYKKGIVLIEDLWITNEKSNYLQNGDFIMLLNPDKTSCLSLDLKNQLFQKNAQLKIVANKKYFELQNFNLVERPINQVKNSDIIYSLWRVCRVASLSQSNNSLVYNRDTIIFRHCLVNACLLKSWSGQTQFSNSIFQLGKDTDQGANAQNCGFYVKNKTSYTFNTRRSYQIFLNHQPLYLQDVLELDHRIHCHIKKIECDSVNYLRLFTQNLVVFSQVLLSFIGNSNDILSNKKQGQFEDQQNFYLLAKKGSRNAGLKNLRQAHEYQWSHVLTVDYDKLKDYIKAYQRIFKILQVNGKVQCLFSNFFIIKTSLLMFQTISNSIKGMTQLKRRKKPILQPLVLSIYQYFLNLSATKYNLFNSSMLNCLKRMVRIDEKCTIMIIYYLARTLSFHEAINIFIQLLEQPQTTQNLLLLTCISQMIQHSSQQKKEETKRIQELFFKNAINVNFSNEEGLKLSNSEFGISSLLHFEQSSQKAILFLKIAIYSEAFFYLENNSCISNEQRLIQLIFQLQNSNCKSRQMSQRKDKVNDSKQSSKRQINHERKPFFLSNLIELINYYLLSVSECQLCTLKNRKFILLKSQQEEDVEISMSINSNSQMVLDSGSQHNSMAILDEMKMGKGRLQQTRNQLELKRLRDDRKTKSEINQLTNIYSLMNYEEPSPAIKQMFNNLDKLFGLLQDWDSCQLVSSSHHKNRSFSEISRTKTIFQTSQKIQNICQLSRNLTIIKSQESQPENSRQILNDNSRQHVCFMIQNMNTVINIMDILLSTGYITIKKLNQIQLFALRISSFLNGLQSRKNCGAAISQFSLQYPITAKELTDFYKQIQSNSGVIIKSIMVEQKIGELLISLNQIFSIIMVIKKKLVTHPGIQILDRHILFNSEKLVEKYLLLYSYLCRQHETPNISIRKSSSNLHTDLIIKLLNFSLGYYHDENEEIVLLDIPDFSFKPCSSVGLAQQLPKNIKIKKNNLEAFQVTSQKSNRKSEKNDKIRKKVEQSLKSEGTPHREIGNIHTACFKYCEEILENLELMSTLRYSLEKAENRRISDLSGITTQIKKLLDLLNQRLRDLSKRCVSQIDAFIVRAYNVPQKLVQVIFCSQSFQQDFIVDIVKFLCENPPNFSNFAKYDQKMVYSFPLVKVFIKSLHKHLSFIVKEATVESQATEELKQAVSIIIKTIQNCQKELKQKEFILLMGIICQVFPNRVVSERIYHILLQMHSEERKSLNIKESKKQNCKKLIFSNSFKDQINIGKGNSFKSRNDMRLQKLCPSGIVDAFKTLQTFKQLVLQAQEEQQKCAEMGSYGLQGSFTQLISMINRHICLIFRVCENSDEVNRHFTQNIIKYDSLLLIAFDPDIPIKYKIPLPIYFRNDDRIFEDEVAIGDYLSWISTTLKEFNLYTNQLIQYVNQNNLQYSEFHCHSSLKVMRHKHNPKPSMMVENTSGKDDLTNSYPIISSYNLKIPSHEYYYWQLLYSRPFMHNEEGLLVLLQQIVTNMKEIIIKPQDTLKQAINKSIMEIYESLTQLYQHLQIQNTQLKSDLKQQQGAEDSILNNLIRKIKKNLKLIFEKYPSLREVSGEDVFSSETIAFNIVNTLIKNNLLKKFIKVFYYNDYRNINLPIFCEKKGKQNLSEASDNSRLSFQHSRSSKMSQSSSNNFRITQMAIMKMSRKDVSIKQFEQEDGLNSNQGLINADRFMKRRSTYCPNTIKLNLNKMHYFEERAYMFYQVSKLLARVCELVSDPQLKSKLEQQFILFFHYRGSSKILKDEIMGVLQYKRLNYIDQNKKKLIRQKSGLIKSIRASINLKQIKFSIKCQNECEFLFLIKDLISKQQISLAVALLSKVWQSNSKQREEMKNLKTIQLQKLKHQFYNLQCLNELSNILKIISLNSSSSLRSYNKYLPLLKLLLLVFLSKQKVGDPNVLVQQKKISSFLTQFMNKILLNVTKYHKKKSYKKTDIRFQRQLRGKKQTIISQVNRMREGCQFTQFKLPEKKFQLPKRMHNGESRQKLQYLPELQIQFYHMIELYAIAEARMFNMQKQLYELISNKLLKMVYGMTLRSSLKLIIKSLLQKCDYNDSMMLPNIISGNHKLQIFIQSKIKQMSDLKCLVSSNMNISENLSFISVYYDYLYRLFMDYYFQLTSEMEYWKNKEKQSYQPPKIGQQIWETMIELEQNIIIVLMEECKRERTIGSWNKSKQKKQIEINNPEEDYQRYCLLHKILSQSINLFNIKNTVQLEYTEWKRNKKGVKRLENTRQICFVWTKSKFIESRMNFTNSKGNSSAKKMRRLHIYKQFYDSMSHLILTMKQASAQLVFSFINQKMSCKSTFETDEPDKKLIGDLFFYKNYKKAWNQSVVEIIKSSDGYEHASTQKNALEIHKNMKQNKIFLISQFLVGQAKGHSEGLNIEYNSQYINVALTIASLIIALFCLVLIYMQFISKQYLDLKKNLQFVGSILLSVNFILFIISTINRVIVYWKVAKLDSFICSKTKQKPSGTEDTSTISMAFHLLSKYKGMFLLTVLMLVVSAFAPMYIELVPLLLIQICFLDQKIIEIFTMYLKKIIKGGWLMVLVMFLVIWIISSNYNLLGFIGNIPTSDQKQILNTASTNLLLKLTGDHHNQTNSNDLQIFENIINQIFVFILISSILGHLLASTQLRDTDYQKLRRQCAICKCESQKHIKYKHNIIKWIDLEINLRCRRESSLSNFEKFLKKKIESRDLTFFYDSKQAVHKKQ